MTSADSALQKRMQRIWSTVCDIPEGAVASYGQIAEITGIPRGARQVGYALKHVPAEREIPWHRVVTSSGKLAFDRNSQAYKRQVKRLQMEDVPVINGRINMKKYRWQPNLDELLWKPSAAWDGDGNASR